MSIGQIFGVAAGMIASFFAILLAYIFVGWGWSDAGGHWTAAQWTLTLIPFSVPFWICFWFVYRCFYTDEMASWDFVLFEIYPRALWRAIAAEVVVVLAIFVCGFVLEQIGDRRSPNTALEPTATVHSVSTNK